LENRTGKYANLPEKIYYQTNEDDETITIYGLNFGDTDAAGAALNYAESKTWTMVGSSDANTLWDALVYPGKDPNKQQYWPIWQFFIENSNGLLNNDHLN
jgi:hypothetical protein